MIKKVITPPYPALDDSVTHNLEFVDEIIEGNKLIATFHGAAYNHVQNYYLIKSLSFMGSIGQMKYHTSWDWLMPVVEKINKIHNEVDIYKQLSKVMEALWLIDIRHLWLAVVEFIKWYNTQKQTV